MKLGVCVRVDRVTEDLDDGGVELHAGAAPQLEQRVALRQRVAVRAIGGHRVVGVADGDGARAQRNVRTGELVRCAADCGNP